MNSLTQFSVQKISSKMEIMIENPKYLNFSVSN